MATTTASKNLRPLFEPDGASVRATAVRDQASPTQTSKALARFEFEAGRGNDGTKILMVEWEDDSDTRRIPGEWHVSWEHKTSTVLSAKDDRSARQDLHRLYFLLFPGQTIPRLITLTHRPSSSSSYSFSSSSAAGPLKEARQRRAEQQQQQQQSINGTLQQPTIWQITPLPAIFPSELGASACSHGKKGVLHTIWAKKRLSELQKEIEAEGRTNVEGIGLQMALQEKEWIEQNFGIAGRPTAKLRIPPLVTGGVKDEYPSSPLSPNSPLSPKTPGGGNRLAEKLKGLRVGTSERELSGRTGPTSPNHHLPPTAPPTAGQEESNHLLSPSTSDVAISSFAAFHRGQPSNNNNNKSNNNRTTIAQITEQLGSANLTKQSSSSSTPFLQSRPQQQEEDDLFAVALSPRSPEMTKSPFSFSLAETAAARMGRTR
ncbi:MAG: hypothetical protein M1816_004109 [Peltula sp. TS41687]|nr:MAG: hypothetical protein M1816_004109 [Peltula sp. TS41687]